MPKLSVIKHRSVIVAWLIMGLLQVYVPNALSWEASRSSAVSQSGGVTTFSDGAKRIALVVGNNKYDNISKLKGAVNDATDIAAALRNLGFSVTLVTDAKRQKLQAAVENFGNKARGANVALFYFSGHGLQIHGENILVPTDYKISSPGDGISAYAVQNIMQEATSGTKIIILDACRNDNEMVKAGLGGKGLAPVPPLQEFIVMYSTAAGKTASDGKGRNSPYTAALLKHINDPVPIETLFKRVARTVQETTKPPQLPANYTAGLTGDFCFTGCGVEIISAASTCRIKIGKGIYEGECRNGKANGQGVQRYADGEYYAGSFADNLRNGYGTQYLDDGTEIVGNWERGRLVNN